MLGNNMFAYCGNNAVTFSDPHGYYKVLREPRVIDKLNVDTTNEEPDPFKWFLTHMARPRSEGNTFSVGFSGGTTLGNTTNGKSGVLSVDSSHNYAFQETTSLGASTGMGGSAGLVVTWTNATNVQDLAGASNSYGATAVSLAGVSIDYIEFVPASNPNTTCWGINIVLAFGSEGELHASQNYTTSTASWNPFIALRDAIYGG